MEPPPISSLSHLRSTALAFHWTVHAAVTLIGLGLTLSLWLASVGLPIGMLGYILCSAANDARRNRFVRLGRVYRVGVAAELVGIAATLYVLVAHVTDLATPKHRAGWFSLAVLWCGHFAAAAVIERTEPAVPPPPSAADRLYPWPVAA